MMPAYRTWIDVDLDAVVENYRTACGLSQAPVTCVVKANAYGLGAPVVSLALQEAGCASFAVSCPREALELRRHGITGEILCMGWSEEGLLPAVIAGGVVLTASSPEELTAMETAAASLGLTANVHLKADTGLHRLGFLPTEENAALLGRLLPTLPHVRVTGLFSHLGLINRERDQMQHDRLLAFRDMLEDRGVAIPEIHLCDSIGFVRYPAWQYGRSRVGAFLYGMRPFGTEDMDFQVLPAVAFRTQVSRVFEAQAGDVVGYNDKMILQRDTRVATLCAGFGDGYPRHLSNGKGRVMLHGRPATVIGTVMMDQMMVDITDIPDVRVGDTADLLGGDVDYLDFADRAETNRNECITILSRRPVRVYHQAGRPDRILDELLEVKA